MTDLDPFQLSTGVYVAIAVVFGLAIGSFINVVIVRLPRMMETEWRRQCRELLGETPAAPAERFDLVAPGSHCPRCGHRLRVYENIPLLSYLFLRGRCSACGGRISFRYPVVEAAAGLLAGLTVWQWGASVETLAALGLTWTLVALTAIDLEHQLLPDSLTLPLLWSGLVLNAFGVITDLHSSLWGAVAGYGTLWVVYWLFKLTTGKEGMGYGDFKLLAAIGAWLGWQTLPLVVILSSVVGAAVGITLIALRRLHRGVPIPFGPFLAAAGWIALLWGPAITGAYWHALGFR